MPELTPELRALRARMGAAALHAKHDGAELTAAGRKAFMGKFELEVDPEGKLSPEERERRAAHARKAHFLGLAFKSAQKRRAGK